MDRLASKITLRKTLLASTAFSAFVLSTTLGVCADVDPAEENATARSILQQGKPSKSNRKNRNAVMQNRSDLAIPLLRARSSSLQEEQVQDPLETILCLGSGINKSELKQLLYPEVYSQC